MSIISRRATTLFALAILSTAPLVGQAIWLDRTVGSSLELQFARSSFEDTEQGILSGAGRLAGTFLLKGSTHLRLELPMARAAFEGSSESTIGAPYLGVVSGQPDGPVRFQVGIRLAPGESEKFDATIIGMIASPENYEAYFSEFVGLRSSVQFGSGRASGVKVQGRIGGTLLVATGEGEGQELLADYGIRAGSESARGFLFADISGRMLVTESELSIGERTSHFVGVSGGYAIGRLMPSIEVRIPLSENDSEAQRIVRAGLRLSL